MFEDAAAGPLAWLNRNVSGFLATCDDGDSVVDASKFMEVLEVELDDEVLRDDEELPSVFDGTAAIVLADWLGVVNCGMKLKLL